MILSPQSALKLVQDHSLVARVPAILPLVERYAQESRQAAGAKGCKPCQLRSRLAPLGREVIAFLLSQPSTVIDLIRPLFPDPQLFVYDPGSPHLTLRELGTAAP